MDDRQLPRSPFGKPRRPNQLPPMTEWRVQPAPPPRVEPPPPRFNRRWLAIGAAALALIGAALIVFDQLDDANQVTDLAQLKPKNAKARPAASFAPIELPGGVRIERKSAATYDLAAWLADYPSGAHSFVFDQVGFDYSSADIRDQDRSTLQELSQILTAYPQVRITIIANGPGALAAERTRVLYDALVALAVDPAQLTMRPGNASETAPRMDVRA